MFPQFFESVAIQKTRPPRHFDLKVEVPNDAPWWSATKTGVQYLYLTPGET